jgi:hypothetical protein
MTFFLRCLPALLFLGSMLGSPAQTIHPALFDQPWPAQWIAHPTAPGGEYGVFHFRKTLELPARPDSFVVHVSADNRYKLYVNGQQVSLGPARGDLHHWFYETVNLAPHLKAGKNVLAAVVWNGGEHVPYAQMTYRTAFILQGNSEAEKEANTGPAWRVTQNEACQPVVFRPSDPRLFYQYYVGGALDSLRADAYPWGWQEAAFADGDWLAPRVLGHGYPPHLTNPTQWTLVPRRIPPLEDRLQRFAALRRAEGVPADARFVGGTSPVTVPPRTKAALLLDQGVLTMGYPELVVSGGKGSTVRLTYAEAPFNLAESKRLYRNVKVHRDQTDDADIIGIYDVFMPDGGPQRLFSPLWFRTFRYVKLEVQTAGEPLRVEDLRSRFSAYPFAENARFESDAPELSRIWEASWRTARLCAHETYMDCPYYEQLQYFGDTRIQALVSLYVSGDDRLMRNAISLGDWSRNPEGITMSRYPSELPQYTPLYSVVWALMVKDYWAHRRDDAFVQSFLPGIRTVFAWLARQVDRDGLVPALPYLDFVDSQYPREKIIQASGSKGMAVHSLFLAHGLDELAPLFAHYGYRDEADGYRQTARKLKEATRRLCYDPGRGLFADTPGKGSFSQHANVLAVLTEAVPPAEGAALLERTLADTSLVPCELYFQFYLFNALGKAGLGDRYVAQLQPWRNMLQNGLSTFSEWEVQPRSDCHAWSASPNYHLLSLVCGITPAGPGFRTVQIQPQLGSLGWVRGTMPHPDGPVHVDFKRGARGQLVGTVTLPPGVTGTLRWNGKALDLKAGTQRVKLGS